MHGGRNDEPPRSDLVESRGFANAVWRGHHSDDMVSKISRRAGRPRTSRYPRAEQLRRAKRAQRERERAAGLVHVDLALPRLEAQKLRVAAADPSFSKLLDEMVVRVDDFAALREIAWNRTDEFISAREAFSLYERNWRFVDPSRLSDRERGLLDRLTERFGAGVMNA